MTKALKGPMRPGICEPVTSSASSRQTDSTAAAGKAGTGVLIAASVPIHGDESEDPPLPVLASDYVREDLIPAVRTTTVVLVPGGPGGRDAATR